MADRERHAPRRPSSTTALGLAAGLGLVALALGTSFGGDLSGLQTLRVWLSIVTLLFLADSISRRLLGSATALDMLVGIAVCVATVIPTLAIGLGLFGLLRAGYFWGAVGALAVGAAAVRSRGPAGLASPGESDPVRVIRGAAFPRGAALPLLALAWVGAALAQAIAWGRSLPPGYHAFDDLSYHLSAAATWWRSGDLRMIKFAVGDPSPAFYPIGGELHSWAALSLLNGSDFLARFTELPFAVAALAATAAIARRLSLPAPAAALAVVFTASVPRIYPELMLSAGNDVQSAFHALALVHAALLLSERATLGRSLYCGLAIACLVGTKYSGPILLPVFAPLLLVAAVAGSRQGGASLAKALAIAAGAALAFGGFAYLRNALATGNPLFPADIRLDGLLTLPGWPEVSRAGWKTRPEYPIDAIRFLFERPEQLGRHFAWILLPGAVLGPLGAFTALRARKVEGLLLALTLVVPAGLYLVFVHLLYDHRDVRYFLAAFPLAAIGSAWLLSRLPQPWDRHLVGVALCASPLWVPLRSRWQLFAFLLASAAVLLLARYRSRSPVSQSPRAHALPRFSPVVLAGAGLAMAVVASLALLPSYERERTSLDPAARHLERLTAGRPSRVAYVGWNQPYLYFGSRLQNEVRIVPTFRDESRGYYTGRGSLLMPRDRLDREEWLRNLEEEEIDYAVVIRGRDAEPERSWLASSPELFQLAWSDGRSEIWEVQTARAGNR